MVNTPSLPAGNRSMPSPGPPFRLSPKDPVRSQISRRLNNELQTRNILTRNLILLDITNPPTQILREVVHRPRSWKRTTMTTNKRFCQMDPPSNAKFFIGLVFEVFEARG